MSRFGCTMHHFRADPFFLYFHTSVRKVGIKLAALLTAFSIDYIPFRLRHLLNNLTLFIQILPPPPHELELQELQIHSSVI